MTTTINASTTAGLVQTADTSGVLALQTAGTTAVSISASQVVTLTNALAEASGGTGTTVGYNGFKNRIINGAMVIDQRNAGASVTGNNAVFGTDRFRIAGTQTSKLTMQQNAGSITPPSGFKNYLGVTSSSAYSVLAGDYFLVGQPVEGFNTYDLGFGASGASTITLSFWVRSSLTGTFGGSINNSAYDRSYPFSYTISTANTWEQKSVTIAGDTTGTWIGATNGVGLYAWFNLGTGSTGSATANAWAAGSYYAPTGATSIVGTNGATFYITGVQLEKGSTATSFDYRPYGTELALCQRYFWRNKSGGSGASLGVGYLATATIFRSYAQFPVSMRAAPTFTVVTDGGNLIINTATGNIAITTTGGTFNTDSGCVSLDMGSSGTAGQGAVIYSGGGSANAAYLQFSSEL